MKRALLLLALFAPTVSAQVNTSAWWGSIGVSALTRPPALGWRVGIGAEYDALTLRLGYVGAEELLGSASLHAVSTSAGSHVRLGRLHLAALAGLAVVWGKGDDPYPGERYLTIGATAEVSVLLALSSVVEFGVEGQVNVNPAFTSAGFGPTLRVKLGGR